MADELELTDERIAFDKEIDIKNIQEKARNFEKGEPGDCDLCGESFSRLVLRVKADITVKVCGRCRDRHGLT